MLPAGTLVFFTKGVDSQTKSPCAFFVRGYFPENYRAASSGGDEDRATASSSGNDDRSSPNDTGTSAAQGGPNPAVEEAAATSTGTSDAQ